MFARHTLYAALIAIIPASLSAQLMPAGYLCCNMRTDGSWISDINYAENGKKVIALGTPVTVTGYGRYRVLVDVGGTKQAIGNDYSRDLELGTFAQRYVVKDDPKRKLASFSSKTRDAISAGRISKGMTREQVLMAVGYPVSSENPNLGADLWRFWLSSFAEFQVVFEGDRVKEITTDAQTRNLVVAE